MIDDWFTNKVDRVIGSEKSKRRFGCDGRILRHYDDDDFFSLGHAARRS